MLRWLCWSSPAAEVLAVVRPWSRLRKMLPRRRYAGWGSATAKSSTRENQPSLFHPPSSPTPGAATHSNDGFRQERSRPQGAPGQDGRWHGQRQGQGRELLPVSARTALHCTLAVRGQPANPRTALPKRSRSSSASQTARPRGTRPATSQRPRRTSPARRPLPASSPTGSGSTTRASSPRMPSTRSAPPCRRRPPTPPLSS